MVDNFEKERYAPGMFDFRYEKPQDIAGIRKVHESAFETRAEAELVDILRDKEAHVISIVAIKGIRIVGHILFSPVTLESDGSTVTLLGLAPMAVISKYQRRGIGSKLVEKGLTDGRAKRYPAVVVLGHPGYYPRFGFVPSLKRNITSEYDVPSDVFMIKELQAGVLAGISGIANIMKPLPGFRHKSICLSSPTVGGRATERKEIQPYHTDTLSAC